MPKKTKFAAVMTAHEFEAVVEQFPGLSEPALLISRAVLVDGQQIADAVASVNKARKVNVSKTRAHQWVRKVYDRLFPEGWETEVITLPAAQMEKVRAMVERERNRVADERAKTAAEVLAAQQAMQLAKAMRRDAAPERAAAGRKAGAVLKGR